MFTKSIVNILIRTIDFIDTFCIKNKISNKNKTEAIVRVINLKKASLVG